MAVAIRRHAIIGWAYLLQAFKVKMAYRANFIAETLGTFAYGFVNIGLLWVLFDRIGNNLSGWTFAQALLIYGMGELTFSIFSTISLGMVFALPSHYILDGQLDRPLLRPLNPLFQCCLEQMMLNDWTIAVKGILIISWALKQPGTAPAGFVITPLWWLASAAVILGGAAIYNGMFFSLACVSFWLKDRVSLTWPLFDFNEFSRYPLTIYPPAVRSFFSWVIPFAFVAFYPSTVLLGAHEYWDVARWWPVVGIGLNGLAYWMWMNGLRSYESSGT
ncbi:MAG: ABC-2 family transporter protein [bacterium]